MICSFMWEYLVIFIKPVCVSDPYIAFYILGTFIYWTIHKIFTEKDMNDAKKSEISS